MLKIVDEYKFQYVATSGKTKFASLNLISLLHPQTPNNEIEISWTYGIALMILNIQGVVAIVS